MIEIVKKINQFDFFDGNQLLTDCDTKTLYYFGRNSTVDFTNSYIIPKGTQDKVTIGLFSGHETCWKYLSDFQPPTRGFEQNDLVALCKVLDIAIKKQADNSLTTECEILFKNNLPHDIIVLKETYGGRQPEGIYIHSVLLVNHDATMKKKYFNCT